MTLATASVLNEVAAERQRQDAKWGADQTNPNGTGRQWVIVAKVGRWLCDRAFRRGRCTWLHIAVEELAEALAETDPARIRAELVQASAVLIE
jgi:hypothetical protein